MSAHALSAAFIGPAGQRLLVVSQRPRGARRGVLLVPPFAEEMNKSRRMLMLVARRLAAHGLVAVLPDLYGTGDSDGEFADGTWSRWQQDLAQVRSFVAEEGVALEAVLAVRLGCALASEVASNDDWRLTRTVFWQPVVDGERFLTQFLRLRVAASMMDSQRRETVETLRSALRSGETVEVAGYDVSPALAEQLSRVKLAASLAATLGAVHWIEVVRGEGDGVSQTSASVIAELRRKQVSIDASVVRGEPFWSSTEILENPVLVERTVEILAAA